MKKNILLSVTGMSPAVVTETLYALVTKKGIIPDEIRVITTQQGKNRLVAALLGIVSGRKEHEGALALFARDYDIPKPHFDESCIQLLQDENGNILPDIRSPEENQLAADQIVGLMAELCSDENNIIHASIAGGRKTMGFFMGYALSLYGRENDSLSHVLVSEAYETLSDFYYPTPSSKIVYDRNGREFDASKGEVMLAEIPWVRLGLGIPSGLIDNKISYSESVNNVQELLKTPTLTFLSPIDDRKVLFGSKEVELSPRGYTFLLSLAIFKLEDKDYKFGGTSKTSNINEICALYNGILSIWKDDKIIDRNDFDSIKSLLSDSRTNIADNVERIFGVGKKAKLPYVPSSSFCCYTLKIAKEDINLEAIKYELKNCLSHFN